VEARERKVWEFARVSPMQNHSLKCSRYRSNSCCVFGRATAGQGQIIILVKVEQEKGRLLHVRDKKGGESWRLIYASVQRMGK
jgi:hypothetical protein